MSVAIAIAGLAFLILIHEAGHFFVARTLSALETEAVDDLAELVAVDAEARRLAGALTRELVHQ